MLLALDIGNSHTKMGVFAGETLQYVASIATDERQTGEQYACTFQNILALGKVDCQQIHGAIICSVVPAVSPIVQQAVALLWPEIRVLNLSTGVKTGLNIRLDQPKALGSDLVANAVWALSQNQLPCVVIDLGTVTTFTVLDAQGILIGTAIAGGVKSTLTAIKGVAAQLPAVQLAVPPHGVVGRNTADAIRAGALYGTAAMIDGMIAQYETFFGQPPYVLLTGGTAERIAPYLSRPITLSPYSTLQGLRLIWKRNIQTIE